MKKRKGFTLVELLAVIVILAIIAVIAIPSILNIINNAKESAFERQKEFIVDAAKKYAVKNSEALDKGYITIPELVSVGLIRGNIKDNKGKVIDNEYVVSTTNGYNLVGGTTKNGDSVVVDNSVGAPIKRIKISGKSEQNGTPTPTTPMPINSVRNFDLVSSGKNLLSDSYTASFVNFNTTVSNQVYTTDFTSGALFINRNKSKITLIPNKNYRFWIISANNSNLSLKPFVYKSDGTNLVSNTLSQVKYGYLEFLVPSDGLVSLSVGGYLSTLDVNSFYMMLTDTSVDYPYPYIPYVSQTINFPNITLRSLPDETKDYIEIDNVAKTAKLYKNVGEIILNDTLNYKAYTYSTSLDDYTYHCYISSPVLKRGCSAISTRFAKTGSYSMAYVDENILTTYYSTLGNNPIGNIYMQLSKLLIDTYSGANTGEKIKSFFSANPTTVQYQLATPVVTDLDYNTYKSIATYQGVTNIYKTGLPSNIEVELYTD